MLNLSSASSIHANCTQPLEAAISMQMALSSSDTSAEQTGDQSDVQNVRLDDFFNFNEREMEQSQKHLQFLMNDKDRELSMLHRHLKSSFYSLDTIQHCRLAHRSRDCSVPVHWF